MPSLSISFSLLLLLLHLISAAAQPTTTTTISSLSFTNSPWRPTQNQTLLSPNSTFAAGFLPLPRSPNLFIFSVWFHNKSINSTTVVWSANDDSPVSASSGSLSVTRSGELRLNGSIPGRNLWPGRPTGKFNSTQLSLSNNGSLIYGNWSSFDFPTNTILPNQAINGTTLVSMNRKYKFVNSSILVYNDSDQYWSTGNMFLTLQDDGNIAQVQSQFQFSADAGETRIRRLTLDDDGNIRLYSLDPNSGRWVVKWQAIQEYCTIHGTCGPNAICMDDALNPLSCVCPPGFRPLSGAGDGSCERKIPIKNPGQTKFIRMDYVNFTGGSDQSNRVAPDFSTCQKWCVSDPKCLGFQYKYDGSGYCVLQIDKMLQGHWSPGSNLAMFLRVDNSETDGSNYTGMTSLFETTCPIRIRLPLPPEESKSTTRNIAIVVTLFVAELMVGVYFFWAFLKKYTKYMDMAQTLGLELLPAGGPKRFTFAELKNATNNFSTFIGKGGFGDVYKGELPDHRVIAVKCLKNVTGGDGEFWAEVNIIARMHHLNLVRLWGFCAEKGQRILVYEYVPNGSLDKFLFPARVKPTGSEGDSEIVSDSATKPVLDWNIRYRIALGVARAIAYLHEECLEWVLHCDIKPENILLGDDFCPRISDFGLAKLRKKEDIVTMSKIRGTRGYMAPEWVKMDPITPKADVYSFGMVLLEIVSGIRNYEIQGSQMESAEWYFPKWAYETTFTEMSVEDILDRRIKHCYDDRAHFDMVNRMVKTAMWCLQDRPEMRPSMGKVAKMLEGTVEIIEPPKPTIFYLDD